MEQRRYGERKKEIERFVMRRRGVGALKKRVGCYHGEGMGN